jgi:hypothetical protein
LPLMTTYDAMPTTWSVEFGWSLGSTSSSCFSPSLMARSTVRSEGPTPEDDPDEAETAGER